MYRYIDNLILISTKTHVSSSTVIISNVPENSLLRSSVVCGSCTRRFCNKRDRFLCERKKEKKKKYQNTRRWMKHRLITISRARNPPVKGLRGDEKGPRVRRIVERCKGQEGGTLEIRDKTPFVAETRSFHVTLSPRQPSGAARSVVESRESRDTPSTTTRSSGPFPISKFVNSLEIGMDPLLESDWNKKPFKGLVKYSRRGRGRSSQMRF